MPAKPQTTERPTGIEWLRHEVSLPDKRTWYLVMGLGPIAWVNKDGHYRTMECLVTVNGDWCSTAAEGLRWRPCDWNSLTIADDHVAVAYNDLAHFAARGLQAAPS